MIARRENRLLAHQMIRQETALRLPLRSGRQRGLRPCVRLLPHTVEGGRDRTPPSGTIDGIGEDEPGPLTLCHGRLPVPFDPDRPTRRWGRARFGAETARTIRSVIAEPLEIGGICLCSQGPTGADFRTPGRFAPGGYGSAIEFHVETHAARGLNLVRNLRLHNPRVVG